jgi:heat-inducible transcriptional repressor
MADNRSVRSTRRVPVDRPAHPHAGAAPSEEELDPRKTAILNAVVGEYIETGEPVGSAHISGAPGVEVSSATVRSDMAALERDGYLTQPHTSAGRIPTDKGYRFYVDALGSPGTLGPVQRQEVRRFFAHVHGAVEDLLGHTSGLLANLTDYASVVVGPTHDTATVRSVQLVDLGTNLALLVVVLSDGAVEKQAFELPGDVDVAVFPAAAAHMTAHLRGHGLADCGSVPEQGDGHFDTALRLGWQALRELARGHEPDNVFVGGSSHMASAFEAVETVRSVLSFLEQQLVVVELVEDLLDRGLSVAIGSEHGFEPLASCALVLAPVSVEGETAGTIGVVGPTRMNYPRALAAVHVVGERLGRQLEAAGAVADRREDGAPRSRPARSHRGR